MMTIKRVEIRPVLQCVLKLYSDFLLLNYICSVFSIIHWLLLVIIMLKRQCDSPKQVRLGKNETGLKKSCGWSYGALTQKVTFNQFFYIQPECNSKVKKN